MAIYWYAVCPRDPWDPTIIFSLPIYIYIAKKVLSTIDSISPSITAPSGGIKIHTKKFCCVRKL